MITVLLVLLLALLGVLASVGVRGLGARRRPLAVAGPVCGQCGYSTTGLASLTCPECGGDFRAVGIITPPTPVRGLSFAAAAVLFTAMTGFVAVSLTAMLVTLVPPRTQYSRTYTLTGPPSQAYTGVTVRAQGSGWGRRASDPGVDVVLAPGPPAGRAASQPSANPAPLRVSGRDPRGRPQVHPEAVLAWLRSAGIDTGDPRIAAEAVRIVAAGREVGRTSRFERHRIGSSRSTSTGSDPMGVFKSLAEAESVATAPPVWAVGLLVVLWVALWVLGLRSLRRAISR